jgi:hypothetical protein
LNFGQKYEYNIYPKQLGPVPNYPYYPYSIVDSDILIHESLSMYHVYTKF